LFFVRPGFLFFTLFSIRFRFNHFDHLLTRDITIEHFGYIGIITLILRKFGAFLFRNANTGHFYSVLAA
jgi:hypothetical protein